LAEEAGRLIQASTNAEMVTVFLHSKRGDLIPVAHVGARSDDLPVSPFREMVVAKDERTGLEIVSLPLHDQSAPLGLIRCVTAASVTGKLVDLQILANQVATSLGSLRRRRELDLLSQINTVLTGPSEQTQDVYDLVARALVSTWTPYAACSIRIRDRRGEFALKSLSGADGVNLSAKDRGARRTDIGLPAMALTARAPVFLSPLQERLDEFHDPNWILGNAFVTAVICPIVLHDESIGVLSLYLWFPHEFAIDEINFLRSLCHHIATATRVVRQLELIERLSTIVGHAGSTDELLQLILDGACDLTGAMQGFISLVSRRDHRLLPHVATRNLSANDIPAIDVDGRGLTALAVRNRMSIRRDDVRTDSDYVDFTGVASAVTRSELVVPLLHEEHALGVIAVQSDQPDYFSTHDVMLLEALAQYASQIYQRERLHEATATLANADFSRIDSARVMSLVARTAAELVDADLAVLHTFDSVSNELSLQSYYPESMVRTDLPETLSCDHWLASKALTTGEIVSVGDLTQKPPFGTASMITANEFSEALSVPLFVPASEPPVRLGVINLFFRLQSPFFDLHRRLLRALGVSASYAIHDLTVLEESNRIQALATVTARMTSALELSGQIALDTYQPLHNARKAVQEIERASLEGEDIARPLSVLSSHLSDLESLVDRLVPSGNAPKDFGDVGRGLERAFRLIHRNLFEGERRRVNVSESDLWRQVTYALEKVVDLLRLPVAAGFMSSHRDYARLRKVAVTRGDMEVVETISLPSFEEFSWLVEQPYVILPRGQGPFSWLEPLSLLGTHGAVLFGHELTGGRLVILAFAVQLDRTLTFQELATLYEAVVAQIFTYIDYAMFGVEMDFLTTEVGHLMGRAIGKVASGTRILQRTAGVIETDDSEILPLARSAVEDGLQRLRLIHTNFGWFSAQRRSLDNTFDADDPLIDIRGLLDGMAPLFRREAADRELKARLTLEAGASNVRGPADLLGVVFLNLYDNAMKFAYRHTYIDITLKRRDNRCIIMFENLGIGVAPDEFKAVFERLRRSRFQDRSRRIEGLGLGLSYCRRVVVDILKGTIELTSRPVSTNHPGRFEGDNWLTTVTVTLPCSAG
jgi:signal transduction histidine kinase/GAF domain-containing protein